MKAYRLPARLHKPSEDSGGFFEADVPLLPGCRAWGETAAEAIENLRSVASEFIGSYRSHGDPLPDEVEQLLLSQEDTITSEILVVV